MSRRVYTGLIELVHQSEYPIACFLVGHNRGYFLFSLRINKQNLFNDDIIRYWNVLDDCVLLTRYFVFDVQPLQLIVHVIGAMSTIGVLCFGSINQMGGILWCVFCFNLLSLWMLVLLFFRVVWQIAVLFLFVLAYGNSNFQQIHLLVSHFVPDRALHNCLFMWGYRNLLEFEIPTGDNSAIFSIQYVENHPQHARIIAWFRCLLVRIVNCRHSECHPLFGDGFPQWDLLYDLLMLVGDLQAGHRRRPRWRNQACRIVEGELESWWLFHGQGR